MNFEILGDIANVCVIARGPGIRDLKRLQKLYGSGNGRKLKGQASIRLQMWNGAFGGEIHWFEAIEPPDSVRQSLLKAV